MTEVTETGGKKYRYGETAANTTVVVLKPCTGHPQWGTLRKVGLQNSGQVPRHIEWCAWFNKVNQEHDINYNAWLDSRLATKVRDEFPHGQPCVLNAS